MLNSKDKMPKDITVADAYKAVRRWYQANLDYLRGENIIKDERFHEFVENLPSIRSVTELEMRAVLREVAAGTLEPCHHASDGKYKMSAYARAAREKIGDTGFDWSPEEMSLLEKSKLIRYLKNTGIRQDKGNVDL